MGNLQDRLKQLALITGIALLGTATMAQDVRITTFKGDSEFTLNGRTFTITRNQDTTAMLTGDFALTSRACPPNCLQPISIAEGVTTIGEVELLTFLENDVTDRGGLLLDTRNPEDFAQGSIPGAVNVPFMTLAPENRFRDDILQALGAVSTADGTLDFTNAMSLAVFSGGLWSSDAPNGVKNLLAAGYPPEKLFYYRGGMQAWMHVGLTVHFPATSG